MSFTIKKELLNGYHMMINDLWRNKFYHKALSKVSKNKVVLDVGTGTGILSVYALNAGATFVYAVEQDPDAAEMAQFILSKCFDQSRFKVICGNFWTTDIDNQIEKNSIDILVSETIGPGLFDQGMIQTWHCAKPFLKKDAISIPDCLSFDVNIWHSDNINEIFNNPPRSNLYFDKLVIDEKNLIDNNYAQALLEFNNNVNMTDDTYKTEWRIVKNPIIFPNREYKDFFKVTKDSLPVLNFYDSKPPMHIQADLKFELDLTDSNDNIIALIHKISFETDTIYLYDASLMPWRFSPVFQIKDSGKKLFRYNTHLKKMTDKEWIISNLEPEESTPVIDIL
jgi:predicted RNA methylase